MDTETRQQIIDRFHSDQTFRDSVLKDANQAVKQEFGLDLPCPMRVVADGSSYRIEPIGGSENGDLSDEQLELVSGGKYSSGPASQPPPPPTRFGRTNLIGPDGGT